MNLKKFLAIALVCCVLAAAAFVVLVLPTMDSLATVLEQIEKWVSENKEWAFSGLGGAIVLGILTYSWGKIFSANDGNQRGQNSVQIESSDISGNVAGRDVNFSSQSNTQNRRKKE